MARVGEQITVKLFELCSRHTNYTSDLIWLYSMIFEESVCEFLAKAKGHTNVWLQFGSINLEHQIMCYTIRLSFRSFAFDANEQWNEITKKKIEKPKLRRCKRIQTNSRLYWKCWLQAMSVCLLITVDRKMIHAPTKIITFGYHLFGQHVNLFPVAAKSYFIFHFFFLSIIHCNTKWELTRMKVVIERLEASHLYKCEVSVQRFACHLLTYHTNAKISS